MIISYSSSVTTGGNLNKSKLTISLQDISGRWAMVEIPNSEHIYMADLVLIALGFTGPGKALARELGIKMVKYLIYQFTCIFFIANLDFIST